MPLDLPAMERIRDIVTYRTVYTPHVRPLVNMLGPWIHRCFELQPLHVTGVAYESGLREPSILGDAYVLTGPSGCSIDKQSYTWTHMQSGGRNI
jgi:hypothetical protein